MYSSTAFSMCTKPVLIEALSRTDKLNIYIGSVVCDFAGMAG